MSVVIFTSSGSSVCPLLVQGQQAAQAGVKFPTEDEDKLGRMLLVGGVSPFATTEQVGVGWISGLPVPRLMPGIGALLLCV